MQSVLEAGGDATAACAGPKLENHRILLQASLDRLWNACQGLSTLQRTPGSYPACEVTAERAEAPRVPGVPAPTGSTRRSESETETEFVVRLLAGYGFDWTDMGFGRADAPRALAGIRGDLLAVSRALARRQPSFLLRAGYLFNFNDSGCAGSDGSSIGGCSRPEVEIDAAAVIAGLLRIQLLLEWYPPARGAPGLWGLAPSMGFQLGF
jgi:hypothetical protein